MSLFNDGLLRCARNEGGDAGVSPAEGGQPSIARLCAFWRTILKRPAAAARFLTDFQ